MDGKLLEGVPADERCALVRLEQRNDLIKWAIGTVGLTLVASVASWHLQNRAVRLEEIRFAHEREMRELEFEQQYLGEFVQYALDADIESRVRFAHYFASVSTNTELSRRWRSYHRELVKFATGEGGELIGGVQALTGRPITRVWLGAEAVASMAEFRSLHVDDLGWSDIGFHYYVALDGTVELARPVGRTPAFVLNHNTNSIAIAVACSSWTEVDNSPPEAGAPCAYSPAQRTGLQELLERVLLDYELTPDVIGKRSDYRPVPDMLGNLVGDMQEVLAEAL